MSEVRGATQQIQGAQSVAREGEQQAQVRENREHREARAQERDAQVAGQRETRADAASAQRAQQQQQADAQALARQPQAAEQRQPPAQDRQEGRGEIVDTVA